MSYKDPTYVVFDGDNDKWAYAYMLGWRANDKIDFHFDNAHELDTMTSNAQAEAYVKAKLRERMAKSSQVVVLVGEKTKNLFRFVRWEIELALDLGLPIIVVNLNNAKQMDPTVCPAILRDECAVHIPFKLAAIRHALDLWPGEYRRADATKRGAGPRHYSADIYKSWGL